MAKPKEIADVIVEAAFLLHELAEGIRDSTSTVTALADSATATAAPLRFKSEGLNKLDARVKNAEAIARAEVEAKVIALASKTRIETAATLCRQVEGLLGQLLTQPAADTNTPAAAAPSAQSVGA